MSKNPKKELEVDIFLSRIKRLQNDILDLNHLGFSLENLQNESQTLAILQRFPENLLKESIEMSDCYQIIYCFENDLRKIINDVMEEDYGSDWWKDHVRESIKNEVQKRKTAEQNSLYFGRGDDPLYFTTLGELKEIIMDNYENFSNHFRSKPFVEELLFQINRLRIVVGHNYMLEEMDITTLKQHVERWYTIK